MGVTGPRSRSRLGFYKLRNPLILGLGLWDLHIREASRMGIISKGFYLG